MKSLHALSGLLECREVELAELTDIRQGMALAGHGVGARPGNWALQMVESADIVEDRLALEDLRTIGVRETIWSVAHLLHPYDILVTARSHAIKVALVPPGVFRTVAAVTLLVVRTPDPGSGLAHFLWYYLSSGRGRAEITSRLTATSVPTLSARSLGEVPVPLPSSRELRLMPDLILESEWSRKTALEAVRARHDVLRDAIIAEIAAKGDE